MLVHGGIVKAIRVARRPLTVAPLLVLADRALAQPAIDLNILGITLSPGPVVFLSALVGVTGFAVWSVIMMMRARHLSEADNFNLRLQVADLKASAGRADA